MKKRIIHSSKKDKEGYFALLCDDNHFSPKEKWREPLICATSASYKEAQEIKKRIEGCLCRHKIKRCSVQITYSD